MGQKINPISLRLNSTNKYFENSWYSNHFYNKLIAKDVFLQIYLNNFLKSLKIPQGVYSIQHLQKKTRISTFFCYPKSTREWKVKIYGLKKKQNSRFFFKQKTEFKRKNRKSQKLTNFYTTLNQQTVYKIQKRITSFQNFLLWSKLWVKFQKKTDPGVSSRTKEFFTISVPHLVTMEPNVFFKKKSITVQPFFAIQNLKKQLTRNYKPSLVQLFFHKSLHNLNLLFLQNLVIYKMLKSTFKLKNTVGMTKRGKTSVPFVYKWKRLTHNHSYFIKKKPHGCQKQESKQMESKQKEKALFFEKFFENLVNDNVESQEAMSKTSFWRRVELQKIDKSINESQSLSWEKKISTPLTYKYKNYFESYLRFVYKTEMDLFLFKVKSEWQHASYLADEIIYFLEKRVAFRRLKSKILNQVSKKREIRGLRITCSGRVGGKSKKAQRAKTECIKYGQTSLHVFSSKIDFCVKTALTSFGSIGVKVWISYY